MKNAFGKMKSGIIFFAIFFFIPFQTMAQENVVAILQKSLKASSQISNGTYEAHFRVKYLTRNDTSAITGTCRFHRMATDTLKGAKFELTANDTRVIYDERKKISLYSKDSLAIIHDKLKYPLRLSGSIYHLLSDYFLNGRNSFKDIQNVETKKTFLKDTLIDKKTCYHILVQPADNETSQNIRKHFYISKDNYFLIGETSDLESQQHHQFSELFLYSVLTNIDGLNSNYGTELIPKNYFVKEYVPAELNKRLSAGTIPPGFTFSSLEGKNISLQDFAGKTIILYFWNGLNQQCRLGLMPLQKLADKYSASGVEIIGMNVSDQEKASLKKYLVKEKVTFKQATGVLNTAEKYNIRNVPAIYVIAKTGKIIEGFEPKASDNIEKKLENIILKNQ